jgi:hypothetical protein
MPNEIYRYFWTKVTDTAARVAANQAALDLNQRLAQQVASATPGSQEASDVSVQQDMARWYLEPQPTKGTKVVVVATTAAQRGVEVVSADDHAVSTDTWEISVAVMPPGYSAQLSQDWLRSPVGVAWATGAVACRLSSAVVTP